MDPILAAEGTALVALVVSIVSGALVLVGLVWQLALHRLDGAQLLVELTPGVWRAPGELQRGRTLQRGHHPARGLLDPDGVWAEMALLQVTNIGRTPVSVTDIALDLGPTRWWRPWARTTVAARPVGLQEATSSADVVRLEPGQMVAVFYAMPAPRDLQRYVSRRAVVRATARPAGRRARRSPRRERWTADADRASWWMPSPGPNARAFQEFFSVYAPYDPEGVHERWLEVRGALEQARPDSARVRDVLVPAAGIIQAIASAERIERFVRPLGPAEIKLDL